MTISDMSEQRTIEQRLPYRLVKVRGAEVRTGKVVKGFTRAETARMSDSIPSNLQSIRERDAGYLHDRPWEAGRYVSEDDDPVHDRHWLLAEIERMRAALTEARTERNYLRGSLETIASGSLDDMPPFRAAPHDVLRKFAQKALDWPRAAVETTGEQTK